MNAIVNSLKMLLVMTVITGIIYPMFITVTGKVLFSKKAEGSIIYINGKPVGSELIGQNFSDNRYFHGRPSASNYETIPASASNKSVTNREFNDEVKKRYEELSKEYSSNNIPQEMYLKSGSGIDPHISPQSALMQIERVAASRNFSADKKEKLKNIITALTEKRDFGILGEERVNVLKLNLAVDKLN